MSQTSDPLLQFPLVNLFKLKTPEDMTHYMSAIFCGSSKNLNSLRDREDYFAFIFQLFNEFLKQRLDGQSKLLEENKIFIVDNIQVADFKEIAKIMETSIPWLSPSSEPKDQKLDFDSISKQIDEAIDKNSITLVPFGFSKLALLAYEGTSSLDYLTHWGLGDPGLSRMTENYKRSFTSFMIVEKIPEKKEVSLQVIAHLSPYTITCPEESGERVQISLQLGNVSRENFDAKFIKSLQEMRLIKKNGFYYWSHFYEILLSVLRPVAKKPDIQSDFYRSYDLGYAFGPLVCAKLTILSLFQLKFEQEAEVLFEKFWVEFEFWVMIQYMVLPNPDVFLIQEMKRKINFGLVPLAKDVFATNIAGFIEKITAKFQLQLSKDFINLQKKDALDFRGTKSTRFVINPKIEKAKYLTELIKQPVSLGSNLVRKQVSYKADPKEKNPFVKIQQAKAVVDELKANYNILTVIQINQIIEELVLELVTISPQEFTSENNKDDRDKAAQILCQFQHLFYSTTFRLVCEAFPDQNSFYDPIFAIKSALLCNAIYALIYNLGLNYWLSEILEKYNVSMKIPIGGQSLREFMADPICLPDKRWVICKEYVQKFLEANEDSKKETIFNAFYWTITYESDKTDPSIKWAIDTAIKYHLNYKLQSSDLIGRSAELIELYFGSKPGPLFCALRDCSYLARFSLSFFTQLKISAVHKNYITELKKQYDLGILTARSTDYRVRDLTIDPNRKTNWCLPPDKQKFQDKFFNNPPNFPENSVIAKHKGRPSTHSLSQYLKIGNLECNKALFTINLLCALNEDAISLNREEDFVFIKKVISGLSQPENLKILEEQLSEVEIIRKIIRKILPTTSDIEGQSDAAFTYLSIIDLLRIFVQNGTKEVREMVQSELRKALYSNNSSSFSEILFKKEETLPSYQDQFSKSVISSFVILLLECLEELGYEDLRLLIKCRRIIAKNYVSRKDPIKIPFLLFYQVTVFFFKNNAKIIENLLLEKNKAILTDLLHEETKTLSDPWTYDQQGFFVKGNYSFIISSGVLYKDGVPIGRMKDDMDKLDDYLAVFGLEQFFVVPFTNIKFNTSDPQLEKSTVCYFSGDHRIKNTEKDYYYRIICLDNTFKNIAIARKEIPSGKTSHNFDDDKNEDLCYFIPQRHLIDPQKRSLTDLPKALRDDYRHWRNKDDEILICDIFDKPVYKVLKNTEIWTCEEKAKLVLPIDCFPSEISAIFTRFEIKDYILVFHDPQCPDKFIVKFTRKNLEFHCNLGNYTFTSPQFNGYVISLNQKLETLNGLKNYILLTPENEGKVRLGKKDKIIIPNHTVKSDSYSQNQLSLELDLDTLQDPPFFAYQIDEEKKALIPEIRYLGGLYLANLYYSTATLFTDPFTNQTGWETAADLLNSLWELQKPGKIEYLMLLRFFPQIHHRYLHDNFLLNSLAYEHMYKQLQNNPPNSIAIWLKVLYLIEVGRRTIYAELVQNQTEANMIQMLRTSLLPQTLNTYFTLKPLINKKCCLTAMEETLLLEKRIDYFFVRPRLTSILSMLKGQNPGTKLVYQSTDIFKTFKSFKTLIKSTKSITQARQEQFRKAISKELQASFTTWLQHPIEFSDFLYLYQLSLSKVFTQQEFESILLNFKNRSMISNTDNDTLIQILFFAGKYPKKFENIEIPKFAFDLVFNINQPALTAELVPRVADLDEKKSKEVQNSVWEFMNSGKCVINFAEFSGQKSLDDAKTQFSAQKSEFIKNLSAHLETHKMKDQYFVDVWNIYEKCFINYLFSKFLKILSDTVQTIAKTENDELFTPVSSNTVIELFLKEKSEEKAGNDNTFNSKISLGIEKQNLKYLEDAIEKARKYFKEDLTTPLPLKFPFDSKQLPDCPAKRAYEGKYGKFLIENRLKPSFSNSERNKITKKFTIDCKQYSYEILQNLTPSDLKKQYFLSEQVKETHLVLFKSKQTSTPEAKKALCLDILFNDKLKSELLEIDEEGVLDSVQSKKTLEDKLAEFITACQKYEYIPETYFKPGRDSLSELFLYSASNQIPMKLYFQLPKSQECVLLHQSFDNNKECINLLFSESNYSRITEPSIPKKEKESDKFPGYLDTKIVKYSISEQDLIKLKAELSEALKTFQKDKERIWGEIRSSINLTEPENTAQQKAFLLKQAGITPNACNSDIFRFSFARDEIKEYNSLFSLGQRKIIQKAVIFYIIITTYIQQIFRVLEAVEKYEKNKTDDNLKLAGDQLFAKRQYDPFSTDFDKITVQLCLFEFEQNILIREDQSQIISAINEDSAKDNKKFYKFMMGDGKSSVIINCCGLVLENSSKVGIVRVNILESLIGETYNILTQKLGGIFKKRVYVLPFHRNIDFVNYHQEIKSLFEECEKGKHVMLVTPEQRQCLLLTLKETLVDFAENANANDKFDFEEHLKLSISRQDATSISEFKKQQNFLKTAFHNAGYLLPNTTQISPNFNASSYEFYQNISSRLEGKGYFGIYHAYSLFKKQSTSFRKIIQKKMSLFSEIFAVTFFDIIDEADEALRHEIELNYTIGVEALYSGLDARITVLFILLDLVYRDIETHKKMKELSSGDSKDSFSKQNSFKIDENWVPISGLGGGNAKIEFNEERTYELGLKPFLVQKVCGKILEKFNRDPRDTLDSQKPELNIVNFVLGSLSARNEEVIMKKIETYFDKSTLEKILVAKAYFGFNILFHVMNLKYNVHYGIVESLEMVVPYKCKDCPDIKSVFSQCEMVMLSTAVSYIYRGLTKTQIKTIFNDLKENTKSFGNQTFQNWKTDSKLWSDTQYGKDKLPECLTNLEKFNLKNEKHIQHAYKTFSRSHLAIEFYLSKFVFPQHCKQYKGKLSANNHDLLNLGLATTFSGTDDSRDMMPYHLEEGFIEKQFQTTGRLIHMVMREENSAYRDIKNIKGAEASENVLKQVAERVEESIKKSEKHRVQMLIDCGALILEITNLSSAKILLQNLPKEDFEGVVYFCDEKNVIKVLEQDGTIKQISACGVSPQKLFYYLDEVHTRGTDLKLPSNAKGIVTISKGMTKDKFLQAILRLRQLDTTQAIETWGEEALRMKIMADLGLEAGKMLDSTDILRWITFNTIMKIQKNLVAVFNRGIKDISSARIMKYIIASKFDEKMKVFYDKFIIEIKDDLQVLYGITKREISISEVTEIEQDEKLFNQVQNLLKIDMKEENTKAMDQAQKLKYSINEKLPDELDQLGNYDANQENQNEVELTQKDLPPVDYDRTPKIHKDWKVQLLQKPDFVKNCLENIEGYPKLSKLNEAFSEISEVECNLLKFIKWDPNIFMTENFKNTVETKSKADNRETQTIDYQNEYIRLANPFLLFKSTENSVFILLSNTEAEEIVKNKKEFRMQSLVSLNFLDDINGPTSFSNTPENTITTTQEKRILMMLQIFNGKCKFADEDKDTLSELVGKINPNIFSQSPQLFENLKSLKLISNDFITEELASGLEHNVDIYFQKESKEIIKKDERNLLKTEISNIQKRSIAADSTGYHGLLNVKAAWLKITEMRETNQEYKNSILYSIFEVERDKK